MFDITRITFILLIIKVVTKGISTNIIKIIKLTSNIKKLYLIYSIENSLTLSPTLVFIWIIFTVLILLPQSLFKTALRLLLSSKISPISKVV